MQIVHTRPPRLMSELIPDELRPFVTDAIRSGDYPDESAVVTAALKLLQGIHSNDLRGQVDAAVAQSCRGEVIPIENAEAHQDDFQQLRSSAIQATHRS